MATYDRLFSIIICIGRDFNYGGIVLLTATGRGMWYKYYIVRFEAANKIND